MGVYISGMEMPFTCLSCDFHKCAGGIGDYCTLTKKKQFRFKNRPSYCPLVHVPPHGDLIERKTAYDSILSGMVMTGYQSKALNCIRDIYVPTIIPADGDE
jgi:hypothetical protein